MYGKTINGILYVQFEPTEGYKPMNYTDAPAVTEGHYLGFFWKENDNAFVQTWELLEDIDEDEEEITDENAFAIIMGEAES